MPPMKTPPPGCPGTRRQFLLDTGMGFTGLALNAMMFRDGVAQAAPSETDVLTAWQTGEAKAKSVIWMFMIGGTRPIELSLIPT